MYIAVDIAAGVHHIDHYRLGVLALVPALLIAVCVALHVAVCLGAIIGQESAQSAKSIINCIIPKPIKHRTICIT